MSGTAPQTPFALTAKALLAAAERPFGGQADLAYSWWADLADATGPALLPFLTRPEFYARAPVEELGFASTPLRSLTPRRGEMWVLFCFRSNAMVEPLSGTPLRSDGFPMVLEWRKDGADSALLSSALRALAVQVRRQLGVSGWSLHPAFDRYGDLVDFTDADLFSDAEHVDNVASAWGALAAGLLCVTSGRYSPEWPFPSVQWDEKRGCTAGVAGLAEKLSVAADCGATVVTVARSQRREASGVLEDLRSGSNGRRFMNLRLYSVRDRHGPRETASEVAFGFSNDCRLRKRIMAAILIPLLGAFFLWGAYYWDTHRSLSKYYAAVVYHYGLPEGIYEVTPEVQQQRGSTFRFDYKGVHEGKSVHHPWQLKTLTGKARRLVRVANVNARNVPAQSENVVFERTPSVQEFEYDENGKLIAVKCRRRGGNGYVNGFTEKVFHYSNREGITNGNLSVTSDNGKSDVFVEASSVQQLADNPSEERCRVSDYVLMRDGEGRYTRKLYYHDKLPTADGDGVGGLAVAYNRDGLVEREWNLGVDTTNRVPDKYGVTSREYTWDGPNLIGTSFKDAVGRLIFGRQGIRSARAAYDVYGNYTNVVFVDAHGRPEYRLRMGDVDELSAGRETVWSNGLKCTTYLLDMSGCRSSSSGLCGVRACYDSRGDMVQYEFFDRRGHLTNGFKGIAKVTFKRDPLTGLELESRYFDADGQSPAYGHDERVNCVRHVYDANGNVTEERLLDEHGELMIGRSGWALCRCRYQEGRRVLMAFYDDRQRPVRNRATGSSCVRIGYELQTGSEVSRRFYEDETCKTLQPDGNGMTGWNIRRDEYGRPVLYEWLGANGCPSASNALEAAGRRRTYEKRLNSDDKLVGVPLPPDCARETWTYLGPDGVTPCTSCYGYSEYRQYIDRCGRTVAESYHDEHGKRCLFRGTDASAYVTSYDSNGQVSEKRAYDVNDEPASMPTDGCHGVRYAYDDRKQVTNCVCIGKTGLPVCAVGHDFSEVRYSHDAWGNEVGVSLWAPDGRPVVDATCGFHEKRVDCDKFGNWLEVAFFGLGRQRVMARVDGMCYWRKAMTYDRSGNLTSERYYDTKDKLLEVPETGFAYCQTSYDAQHRPIEVSWYDSENRPCSGQVGVARMEMTYFGSSDRVCRKTFHAAPGPDGSLWRQKGVVRAVSEYAEDLGQEPLETVMFGSDGAEVPSVWAPCVTKVDSMSVSAAKDVRMGDVLCAFGELRLQDSCRYRDIRSKCDAIECQSCKRMVLARKEGDRYVIRAFDYGPGPTGVRFMSTKRTKAEFTAMTTAVKASGLLRLVTGND